MKILISLLCFMFFSVVSTSGSNQQGKFCMTPDFKEGTCLALGNCDILLNVQKHNQNNVTFENFLNVSNLICELPKPIICCPKNISNRSSFTNILSPVSERPTLNPNKLFLNQLPTIDDNCGISIITTFPKVANGARLGTWPWIALLGYVNNARQTEFKCGGSLITNRHVVTAAQCIDNSLQFVRLGEHDLKNLSEAVHIDVNIAKVVRHPEYDPTFNQNDIAILYLASNIQFTNFVRPICILNTPELKKKSYLNYNPFRAGWKNSFGDPNVIQYLQMTVLDNNACKNRFQELNYFISEKQFDNNSTFCAGTDGIQTCFGEIGGSLMMPIQNELRFHFHLLGIASYLDECKSPSVPARFTSGQYFADWIQQKVAETQIILNN